MEANSSIPWLSVLAAVLESSVDAPVLFDLDVERKAENDPEF